MANFFCNYINKTCVVILKLAEIHVTILFTPIVHNYSVTFYLKFKNLIIVKICYIICVLICDIITCKLFNINSIYLISSVYC